MCAIIRCEDALRRGYGRAEGSSQTAVGDRESEEDDDRIVARAGDKPQGRRLARPARRRTASSSGEQFYFFTVVIMWLIHAGFMSYETGIARKKNALATAMKNILTIAVVTPTFYYFGWWIYNCNQPGLPIGPNSSDFTARGLPGRHPVVRRLRPEPDQQHQPGLLPGVPAVLLDDGLDHVRRDASSARGSPAYLILAVHPRLGRLDPRRRLGLERRRLDDAPLRLPRLDRVRRGARRGGRVHARVCSSTSGRE